MAGIYIHVPFCQSRCAYCDFYSTTLLAHRKAYVDTVCRELHHRQPELQGEAISTIYFGGGTPSTLSIEELKKILEPLINLENLDNTSPEITLEANPDDLTEEYVQGLRTLPINRVSIGIQSFHDRTLRLVGRRHTAQEAIDAVHRLQRHGLTNISIDLIYGLPGETIDDWSYNLDQAVALGVKHISAYHLIYEEDTALWKLREQHRVEEADEELSVSLFTTLIDRLTEAGYQHYEISNFCLPSLHSRHNSSYWTGKKYLGCGPSAHSFNGVSRQWNVASLEDYLKGVEAGQLDVEVEELDLYTRYNDFVLTSIRTCWGMPLSRLRSDFGEELYRYGLRMAQPHLNQGMLEICEDVLRLTRKGIFVSDGIMSDLMWVN